MSKRFRLTIRKKILLLTALLSVALILVSATVASAIFTSRLKKDAKALCLSSAETLRDYFAEYQMQIDASNKTQNFVLYYKEKLDEIYRENREEIERMSEKNLSDDADFAEKKTYFVDLTQPLYGGGMGFFGASYDKVSFKNSHEDVLNEMERLSSIEGMSGCYLFYYDAERGNIVYMCDSTYSTSWSYRFAGSTSKVTDDMVAQVIEKDAPVVLSRGDFFVSYAPIEINGETQAYVSFEYSLNYLLKNEREFVWMLVSIMLAATVAIVAAYLILANIWLVRNITRLSASARAFTSQMNEGAILPEETEITTHDEIRDLSDDFFALQNKVIVYSEDLARQSAADERMRAELNIASKIQLQALPDKPLAADNMYVSSFIKPAKEVGGDLFDYFMPDEGKLFFAIADVSGKGVPAALFMMRGKEIIRSCAKAGMSADVIAATANAELCKNNKEGLFITAFIGIYDVRTGTLTFVRAGHEQPYLLRQGVADKVGEESNFVLGVFDNVQYKADVLQMRAGDKLLLYTDGLNEGVNSRDEAFGYDRIREVLESAGDDVLAAMYQEAVAFAGDAEQFDDITMLLCECVQTETITLASPTYQDIPFVTDQINALVQGYDRDKIAELDVILDEVLNNYVSYAFDAVKKPQVEVTVRLNNGVVTVTFVDNGVLFDPLAQKAPDVDTDITVRPLGGMGIHLVRTIADRVVYRVFDGKNRLVITKDLRG